MSESFKVTREQFEGLLEQFYKFSTKMKRPGKLNDKLNDTWDSNGKLSIYIVKVRAGSKSKYLKKAKEYIRDGYDTMHVLHTSDDQNETVYFAEHIYNKAFLQSMDP